MNVIKGFTAALCVVLVSACADSTPTDTSVLPDAASRYISVPCSASLTSMSVSCETIPAGVNADLIGGQNLNVKLTSSPATYDSGTEIFSFDVTVQNLMNESIGMVGYSCESFSACTTEVADPEGIIVFFYGAFSVTEGSGEVTVNNADGVGTFTTAGQSYFAYNEVLSKDEVSSSKTWRLNVPPSATKFTFNVLLETEREYKLVINEVMVNPASNTIESTGDWFEIYNAGSRPVDLQGLVIADSAASGRRPYHVVASSVIVQPGLSVVFGATTNTTSNGGVPVDYAWGGSLTLVNSLDALKIARVHGFDTLYVDRTQYSQASVSAQDGISRELKNPAFDNANMDGSNWASALVTAVYGSGGRGTPKAQNSTYTP